MYKKTCYNCNKIFETEFPFSFYCNNCCKVKLNLKPDKDDTSKKFGVAGYSGYVGYLKHILKQKNWMDILNSSNGREFTYSKF